MIIDETLMRDEGMVIRLGLVKLQIRLYATLDNSFYR